MFNLLELLALFGSDFPHIATLGKLFPEDNKEEREKFFGYGIVFYFFLTFMVILCVVLSIISH